MRCGQCVVSTEKPEVDRRLENGRHGFPGHATYHFNANRDRRRQQRTNCSFTRSLICHTRKWMSSFPLRGKTFILTIVIYFNRSISIPFLIYREINLLLFR